MKLDRVFFFLLILFLPTQLGYHFWPDWSLVLGRRVDYLSPTIFLTDVLILLTLIAWRKFTFGKKYFLLAIFIFLNIFFSPNQPEAMYTWVKVLEFSSIGYYIIKTKPKFSSIIFFLSLGVLYSSLLAIVQFFLQHSIGGPLWFLGERTFTTDTPGIARINWGQEILRPYGTFPHPNVLGGFLAATLPLVIRELFKNKKIFYVITLAIGCMALFLTFSRSAIIVGVLAMGFVLWQKMKQKKFLIVLMILFLSLIAYRLSLIALNDESVVVREELNTAAVKIWQQSPLVGVGLGNFLVELPKTIPTRTVYFLQPVHNIYLLLLTETGIVGLIFSFWIIMHNVKKFTLPLIILLLLGLVDHYALTLQQGQLLLTLFLALSI